MGFQKCPFCDLPPFKAIFKAAWPKCKILKKKFFFKRKYRLIIHENVRADKALVLSALLELRALSEHSERSESVLDKNQKISKDPQKIFPFFFLKAASGPLVSGNI